MSDLERQVGDLTRRVAALEQALELATNAETVAPPAPPPPVGLEPARAFAAPPQVAPPAPAEQAPRVAMDWDIESVLRWAGVALVTLAALFLISTSITRGWIGPELQLGAAAVGGGVLHLGALRLASSRRPWALALGCGGAIVLAACALATHGWLDLVGPGVAVGLAGLATVISAAVAFKTRLEGIAVVAGLVGMFAPIDSLSSYGDGAILGWVVAFIVAASFVGWVKAWAGLRLIVGWLGGLLVMMFALTETATGSLQVAGFVGVAVIATVLWLGPTLAKSLGKGQPLVWQSFDWTPIDYRLVGLVPAWVWAVAAGLLSVEGRFDHGLVALAVAAGAGAVALLAFGRVERLGAMSTVFGALTLLAVGLALLLDGPGLMVALAGQAAGSYYLAQRLDDEPLRLGSYVVAAAASLLAIREMVQAIDFDGFENAGAVFATGVVVACWIGAAWVLHGRDDQQANELRFDIVFVGAWVGSMIWLAATLLGLPQGLMLISAAWAVMAAVSLVIGLRGKNVLLTKTALATLAATLVKLFTVDLAEIDVFWRVGLFLVVGSGLIALGLKVPSLIGTSPTPEPPPEAASDPSDDQGSTVTTF